MTFLKVTLRSHNIKYDISMITLKFWTEVQYQSGMGRLHVKCNRLRLRALQGFTIAITITITAILYVIDYDCDYIGM